MKKLCALALLLSTSAYSQTETSGPTLPMVKEVHNQEESRMHMGVNFGINNPEGSRGATPEFGVDLGLQPLIPFGFGVELNTSRFVRSDDESYKRTSLLARGTYNFGGDIPVIRYSYFGLATGPIFIEEGTRLGIAPLMGFDIPITEDRSTSLGFMTKFLFVTGNAPDSLMTSAALKYWF